MSSATIVGRHPIADGLASMRAAADRFAAGEFWRLSGRELADSLEAFELEMRRLEFGRLQLLAEFDAQDIAGEEAGLSTEAFLRARLRLSPGEAKARVRSAQELVGRSASQVRSSTRCSQPPLRPRLRVPCRASTCG